MAQSETLLPLLLVGPGGWGVDAAALIAGSTVDARHLGSVPSEDLRVLYDLADVFVYPSLMEGFGMPVLEAMAQGTAVVTSGCTATSEVAGNAGVLVDPTSVDSIAAGIDSLVGDDARREKLALAAAQRAETMTWERTASEIAAVYNGVIK